MRPAPLDMLGKICADVRPGEEPDAVDGTVPGYVASPATVEEAGGVMRVAAEHGWRVIVRGAGTKLDWGRPPSACDLVFDSRRLDRVIEHAAGDLVVATGAGLTLQSLREALAGSGQQLALDSPLPGATVGGALATATSGPRRLLYGTARDLLIGITIVRADGAVAKAGGKVVKNVAGYDLGKLFTGSYGTLGIIVEATFRLHPLPAARAYVTTTVDSHTAAVAAVRAVRHSPYVPAAIELDRPGPDGPITVTALLEGVAAGTAARAAAVGQLLGTDAQVSEHPPDWWGHYPGPPPEPPGAGPGPGGDIVLQVTVAPEAVAGVLDRAARADLETGTAVVTPVAVRGSAATGVLHLGLPADTTPESTGAFLGQLRHEVEPAGGSAIVLRAPRAVRETVDLWGTVPGLPLMRRIKDQFDPEHLLAPGRFVGGI